MTALPACIAGEDASRYTLCINRGWTNRDESVAVGLCGYFGISRSGGLGALHHGVAIVVILRGVEACHQVCAILVFFYYGRQLRSSI